MKTAIALAAWAKARIGQPYWYGTCCYPCSESLLNAKSKQYPSHYTPDRLARYKEDIAQGLECADCVGLIKGYLWANGGSRSQYPDRSADGLFSDCIQTGAIHTLPDIPGLLIWRKGHIGIYIGDGMAVQARSFNQGTQKPW